MQTRSPRTSRRRWAALALSLCALAGSAVLAQPATAGEAPPEPECPSVATPNGRYVQFIYSNILYRCPDAGGQVYWTNLLDGGLPRAYFTSLVDMSDENLGQNNADELYDGILDRAPTAGERTAAMADIRARKSDAVVIATLASSDEYYDAQTMTDEEWIADAYQSILDRDADAGGAAYYLGTFGADGSNATERFNVAIEMEYSAENAESWVTGIYYGSVQRPPSAGELALQIAWLRGPGGWQSFQLWSNMLATDAAYAIGSVDGPSQPK